MRLPARPAQADREEDQVGRDRLGRRGELRPGAAAGVSNLLEIEAALEGTTPDDVARRYDGLLHGALKANVAEAVLAVAEPFAARTAELLADRRNSIGSWRPGLSRRERWRR